MTPEEKLQIQSRGVEICQRFLMREAGITEEEYRALTIQDLCVLITNARMLIKKANYRDDKELCLTLNEHIWDMHTKLIAKIKAAENVYIIIDQSTRFPYIDNKDNGILLFSRKVFADDYVEEMAVKQFRRFEVLEISKLMQTMYIAQTFFMYGVKGVHVDRSLVGCFLEANDFVAEPDVKKMDPALVPVMNPDFMRAYLKYSQEILWKVDYPERKEVLEELEKDMAVAMKDARFLIPAKGLPGEAAVDRKLTEEESEKLAFAVLSGADGKRALPVFSDWEQFKIAYSDVDYKGFIIPYADLADLFRKNGSFDAIVFNYRKCPMELNKQSLQRLEKLMNVD